MLKLNTNRIYLICQDEAFSANLKKEAEKFGLNIAGNSHNIDEALWEISVLSPFAVIMNNDNSGTYYFDLQKRIMEEINGNIIFVLVSNSGNENIIDEAYLSGFSFCSYHPCNISLLAKKLNELAKIHAQRANSISDNSILYGDSEVEEMLISIGVPKRCTGFSYLVTGIGLVMNDFSYTGHFTDKLYPCIAAIHSTKPSCVERNIRTAIDAVWDRGNTDLLSKIINCAITSKRGVPTNSMFISILAEYIRTKY